MQSTAQPEKERKKSEKEEKDSGRLPGKEKERGLSAAAWWKGTEGDYKLVIRPPATAAKLRGREGGRRKRGG